MTEARMGEGAHGPDRNELRKFAFVLAVMIAAVFGLFFPWVWTGRYPTWPWIVALVLVSWGMLAPLSLARPYRWWMRFAEALGWINNRIILGSVFFVLILPFGLVRRLLGGDPMRRKLDPPARSYRVERAPDSSSDLRRPY